MLLGLSSYTYGWAVGAGLSDPASALDEMGLLDRCGEHGMSLLQIGDNLPLHTFTEDRLDLLAARARREGVRLEVGARCLTLENIARYTSIARRVGARLIRFVIDDAGYHPTPEHVTTLLREALPQLDGLTLGIENHDRFPAAVLRQILSAVASDRVGICLDTANSLGAGEGLETVVRELAPWTVNLHVKDFHVERVPHLMGFHITGRPAGAGLLDIPALLRQLTPEGRCETAVLELWTPPEPTLHGSIAKEAQWAEQSIRHLRPLFPGFGAKGAPQKENCRETPEAQQINFQAEEI